MSPTPSVTLTFYRFSLASKLLLITIIEARNLMKAFVLSQLCGFSQHPPTVRLLPFFTIFTEILGDDGVPKARLPA